MPDASTEQNADVAKACAALHLAVGWRGLEPLTPPLARCRSRMVAVHRRVAGDHGAVRHLLLLLDGMRPHRPASPARPSSRHRATLSFQRPGIKEKSVLYTIAVVLVILWLLGLVTSVTMGGLIHILLVIALVVVLLKVISGRSPI
jgi:Family of unknown function (DUF5670)